MVAWTVIVLSIVVLVVATWLTLRGGHPDDAASREVPADRHRETDARHAGVDRPAGPGAEADGVVGPGQLSVRDEGPPPPPDDYRPT